MERLPPQLVSKHTIFTPQDLVPGRTLLIRFALVLALIFGVIAMLWLDRDGLKDHADGEISFTDVVYFSFITITTVGYGDIVPVTPRARLLDALVVTPVRIFVWLLFLGTAYQLLVRQYMEGYRMAKLQATLDQHIIICGFGETGSSIVKELLAKGTNHEQVIVIDQEDDRVGAALEQGVVALRGDAAHETVLKDVAVDRAKAIIIACGRDDTNALVLLTARHLSAKVRIIVSAQLEENIKLFRQGGANSIISPATFGGYLLAAAVEYGHLVHYLEDLLTSNGRVQLIEQVIGPQEVGKTAEDMLPDVVVRVYRQGSIISLWDFKEKERFQEKDVVLMLHQTPLSV